MANPMPDVGIYRLNQEGSLKTTWAAV